MNISTLYQVFKKHPNISTDSRNCPENSIFFALKGDSFNGNQFACSALEQGAAFAVIDEKRYQKADDPRYILVNNVLETLQQLANYHRRQLGTRIIAITGTNGKTTTKELVAAVLGKTHNVLYTEGNLNNHIGVPKTLLRLTAEHDIAVIEMGANHPGEIKQLAEIAEPNFGLITNVGIAHIEGFGSFEGVVQTKGELYDYLRTQKKAVAFIQNNNEHLRAISDGLILARYAVGWQDDLFAAGEVIDCTPFLNFKWRHANWEWQEVHTKLVGTYNIDNLLAAIAIGCYFEVPIKQINDALESYTPSNNRSQLMETSDNKLIIDAYNANPTSMSAAITNFRQMAAEHKMVILGDMKELGEVSQKEHLKIIEILQTANFEEVWLVGEEFAKAQSSFRHFANVEEVKAEIDKKKPKNFHILIKGSNSTKLFQLPTSL